MKAFIFPGQGSQSVGMGREIVEAFPCARDVLNEVDDALSQKLSHIIFEGPESDLTLTENTQPALMAISMAVFRVLEREGGLDLKSAASYVAGHSLGEYSALCAAGALSLADTARLLKLRGQSMQKAVSVGKGAMAAVLGLTLEQVEVVAREASKHGICAVANDNADGQVVLSGEAGAIDAAIEIAKEMGAKRSILLNVSAPFHCALMQPAADAMREALSGVTINSPIVPVIANVTAGPVTDANQIRNLLVEQVTGRVRWRESVMAMGRLGVAQLIEVGAGKVLSGLTRRIDENIDSVAINTPQDIESFLEKRSQNDVRITG